MKPILSNLLALVCLLLSCAPSYFVNKEWDESEGSKKYIAGPAWLKSDNPTATIKDTTLYPGKIVHKDGSMSYFLKLMYLGSDWIFIERGESLELSIDGNDKLILSGTGSQNQNEAVYAGMVSETSWYPIKLEELKKISNAGFIKAKIIGSKGYIVRAFSAETHMTYKKFANDCGL